MVYLNWEDFKTNIAISFRSFRQEDKLNDVTLIGDDNIPIYAHKLVLSSSSGYFKDIFIKNNHPHPILCLVGVNSQEVNNILDYIYYGEVQIHQDNLDLFLEVAKKLRVESIVTNTDNENFSEVTKVHKSVKDEILIDNKTYDGRVQDNYIGIHKTIEKIEILDDINL